MPTSLPILYDRLYQQAAEVLASNPCEIHDGQCARGRSGDINFCCHLPFNAGFCENLDLTTGCKADKPLWCRLYICDFLKETKPRVAATLATLASEAITGGLVPEYFIGKKQYLATVVEANRR